MSFRYERGDVLRDRSVGTCHRVIRRLTDHDTGAQFYVLQLCLREQEKTEHAKLIHNPQYFVLLEPPL